jgi:hypothetical protein
MSRVRVTLDTGASLTYKHMTVKNSVPRVFVDDEAAYWLTQKGCPGLRVEVLDDTYVEPQVVPPIQPDGYTNWIPGGKNRARVDMVPATPTQAAPIPAPGSDSASDADEGFDVGPEDETPVENAPQSAKKGKGRKNVV